MAEYPSKPYPASPRGSKYMEQIEGIVGLFVKERDLGYPHRVETCENSVSVRLCIQVENIVKQYDSDPAVGERKHTVYLPLEREVWDRRIDRWSKVKDEEVFRKVAERVVRMYANVNNGRVHYRAMAVWVDGMDGEVVLFGE